MTERTVHGISSIPQKTPPTGIRNRPCASFLRISGTPPTDPAQAQRGDAPVGPWVSKGTQEGKERSYHFRFSKKCGCCRRGISEINLCGCGIRKGRKC